MPAPPAQPTEPARSILLVEEYDALALAIESALKKFAPQHRAHPVRTLADARTLALGTRPELIIIDFDPPLGGVIAFLEEMRTALPASRVLIVAAGTPRELVNERGSNGALQFLEKPFELVDFGAAVQALLGPWMETGASRGTLCDLGLVDVAALGCLAGTSALVQVRASGSRTGQLHWHNGHLVHAVTSDAEGQSALVDMLLWGDAHFVEGSRSASAPGSLHGPWTSTLLEALREAKKRMPPPQPTLPPSEPRAAAPAVAKTGPKILVIDDTEMLLIFVEDSLAIAEPAWQIKTIASGLVGVKEAARMRPDLALVDYSLPDIKGDEICRRLLVREETARLPVVMMSGHVFEMQAAAKRLPNIVATIAKPFLSDALISLVRATLQKGPLPVGLKPPAEEKPSASLPAQARPTIVSASSSVVSPPPAEPTKVSPASPLPPAQVERPVAPLVKASGKITKQQLGAIRHPKPAAASAAEKIRKELPSTPPLPRPEPPSPAAMPRADENATDTFMPRLGTTEVLLDLPLDVVAMQFTAAFQIGSIRARPASPTVAIEIPGLAARTALPLETGFQLGNIDLDPAGRIATVRLLPTAQPFHAVQSASAFNIGGVAVVPANERERLQLMSSASSTMTMQLFAPLELQSIELSANLEVKQLVLRCRSNAVRVTLNSQPAAMQNGANFITTAVELDESRRIRELTLAPLGHA